MVREGQAVEGVGYRFKFHDKVNSFDVILYIPFEAPIGWKRIGNLAFHYGDGPITQPHFIAGVDDAAIADDGGIKETVCRDTRPITQGSQVIACDIGLKGK